MTTNDRRLATGTSPCTTRFCGLARSLGPSQFKKAMAKAVVTLEGSVIVIRLPDRDVVRYIYEQTGELLQTLVRAAGEGEVSEINLRWPNDSDRPLRMMVRESADPQPSQISAWGHPHLRANAGTEEILDFLKAHQSSQAEGGEGLVVTVTSMKDHKCLSANTLQALDRGGGWSTHDWIGTDFLQLWRDSFLPGRKSYLTELLTHLERDRSIRDFYYQIRRPSGALAEYWTTYYQVEDFMGGGPVRVGVSKPGAWNIIEGRELE